MKEEGELGGVMGGRREHAHTHTNTPGSQSLPAGLTDIAITNHKIWRLISNLLLNHLKQQHQSVLTV